MLIYSGIVAFTALFVGTFTLATSLTTSVIAAVIIALLFEPARKKVQNFVDKKFFRIRYNYRLVQRKMTDRLNNIFNLKELAELVTNELDSLLQPELLGFFIRKEKGRKWFRIVDKNCHEIPENQIKKIYTNYKASKHIIIAVKDCVETGAQFEDVNEPEIFPYNTVLSVLIKDQGKQVIGMLILGKKKSGLRYSLEDIDLLNTIASRAGLSIDRIRLQQKLILKHEETQRLEEISQLKSLFVSSVSHEMQTPLTSIKMFAELLQSKKEVSKNDKQEYLEIIEGESDRLARLIKNVLDFSKIERGVKDYNFKEIDLKEVVQSVMRLMRYQLKQHSFEVDINLPKQEVKLTADADAVVEAISNLISNSIKYSLTNKYISVSVIDKNKNKIVEVKDKGAGISEEDQKHIFEAFYRSKRENVQTLGGAGLGLTIVQDIMKAHNGKIEIESKPNFGSTLRLVFPKNLS